MKKTHFYEYNQNNSGGHFDVDKKLCSLVIIEAHSAKEANSIAEDLGCYWNGVDAGRDCDCCGDRWYKQTDYIKPKSKTFDIVEYVQELANTWSGWTKPVARIFFLNGKVKQINGKHK